MLTHDQKVKVYFDLGMYMKRIHSVKTEGYGDIQEDGKGKYKSLRKFLVYKYRDPIQNLEKLDFFNDKFKKKIRSYLRARLSIMDAKESVLLHSDLGDANIQMKKDKPKIASIIDFGDLKAGPKSYDFSKLFIEHYYNGNYNHIVEGYGGEDEIEEEEVLFFSVVRFLWLLPFHYEKKNKEKLEMNSYILKSIIGNKIYMG